MHIIIKSLFFCTLLISCTVAPMDVEQKTLGIQLCRAAFQNDLDDAKELLNRGVSPNITGDIFNPGRTPLIIAAERGYCDMAALLILHGACLDYDTWSPAGTALLCAVRTRSVAMVELLIKAGADINKTCSSYRNALDEAVQHGPKETIKLLLAHGADVFKKRPLGSLPYSILGEAKSSSRAAILIERMLEFPNHNQHKRIVPFLCGMRSKFGRGVASLCKNHVMAIMKEENKQLLKDKIWVRIGKIPMESELAYEVITQKCYAFEEIILIGEPNFRNRLLQIYGEYKTLLTGSKRIP